MAVATSGTSSLVVMRSSAGRLLLPPAFRATSPRFPVRRCADGGTDGREAAEVDRLWTVLVPARVDGGPAWTRCSTRHGCAPDRESGLAHGDRRAGGWVGVGYGGTRLGVRERLDHAEHGGEGFRAARCASGGMSSSRTAHTTSADTNMLPGVRNFPRLGRRIVLTRRPADVGASDAGPEASHLRSRTVRRPQVPRRGTRPGPGTRCGRRRRPALGERDPRPP